MILKMSKPAIALVFACIVAIAEVLGSADYSSYSGTVLCEVDQILSPTSTEQVQQYVKDAITRGYTLRPIGSLHSSSRMICDNNGFALRFENMAQVLSIDTNAKTVTVQPGVYLSTLLDALNDQHMTLPCYPDYSDMTIAGILSNGAHGSTISEQQGPSTLHDNVVSMKIVDGLGNVQVLTRQPDLDATVVSLGLLGIAVEYTIKIVPQFFLEVSMDTFDDSLFTQPGSWEALAASHEYVEAAWFSGAGVRKVFATYYDSTLQPGTDRNTRFPPLYPEFAAEYQIRQNEFIQKTNNHTLNCDAEMSNAALFETGAGFFNTMPAVGFSHKIQASRCDVCAWAEGYRWRDRSFALPIYKLSNFVQLWQQLLTKLPYKFCLPMMGFFIRFAHESTSWLAPNAGRVVAFVEYTVPIQFTTFGSQAFEELDQILAMQLVGRAHWGKNTLNAFLNTTRKYSRFEDFVNRKQRMDPHHVFYNELWSLLANNTNPVDADGCALIGDCYCREDRHCDAATQFCGNGLVFTAARVCINKRSTGGQCTGNNQCLSNSCVRSSCR